MASPDLAITTNAFLEFGGQIFGKNVLDWSLRAQGIQVRVNVNKPQALTRLSTTGTPRPYAAADHTSGNAPKFTDRILTAYQSKWDYDFDPEEFRNTYLASGTANPYYQEALNQVAKEYLDYLQRSTLYAGVRNGAGTAPADICDGWGTIIAAEIVGGGIVPITTGALANTDAVTKVDAFVGDSAFPIWMREKGFILYCSYATFDKYVQHYRTLNGFGLRQLDNNDYRLDNKNGILRPVAWMGTSARLIATVANNLVFGTDMEQIAVAASTRRNIIEVRNMMPAGCEIQDLDAIAVNDQA